MPHLWPSVLVALGGVACGPSFQAVYECDVHFEHCYAQDQRSIPPDAKKECWREWLHGYTYGQSRDRVEYAATRFSELSLDPTLPQEEARGARPRVSARSVVAPVPTNAFAPPPNIIDRHDAAAPSVSGVASAQPVPQAIAVHAPGAACAEGCGQLWSSCHATCRDTGCNLCDSSYRACMPDCFRGEPAGAGHPSSSAR